MELRTVRYVLAVADAGSVVAAAEALHMTQPALSRAVRQLEHELGAELFVRGAGALQPSAAGRQLLPTLRRLAEQADAADRTARAIARGRVVEVVFTAAPSTLSDIVAPFIATMTKEDPWPAVRSAPSEAVYRALGRGADLAIGPHEPPAEYGRIRVGQLPVFAHVPPGHRWADRTGVRLDELASEVLLVQPPAFHARGRLDAALIEAHGRADDLREFDSAEVAMAVAAAGRGVAVVSDDPRFGLVPLTISDAHGPVVFSLFAAWSRQHHAASQLESLGRRLAGFCAARYAST